MSWKNNGYLAAALLAMLALLILLPIEGDLMVLLGSIFLVMLIVLLGSLCVTVFGVIKKYIRARRKSLKRTRR